MDKIIQILQNNSDIFKLDTILARTVRELLWGIVKVLGYIVDSISTVTDKLFVLDTFYNSQVVVDFINSVKPLIAVLFALSLLGIGYQLMFSQTKQFRKIGTNVLVALAVILVLPMAMDRMNTLTGYGVNAVKGNLPTDITNEIIKSNVGDLVTYDKSDFNKEEIKKLSSANNIKIGKIRYIDPTSLMEPSVMNEMTIKNKEVFSKKLVVTDTGDFKLAGLNQGWMTFWKEYYYRFNVNFLNIIVSLGVIGATLAFTCFKLAKMIFELAYNKFLAILVAPADINDGQKTKQVIQNIMSTFIVVFLIAVLLKFYVMFIAVCARVTGMEGVILLVAGSFAVIDGPNLVEKLFGIDAGLQSGFKTMAGAYMVGSAVMGGASKLGSTAKSMAEGAGKVAGSTLGASAGMVSGLGNKKSNNSLYEDMAKDKAKKTDDANKGKSIYPGMAKDKAKGNGNPINSSTANSENSSKKNGTSSPEADTKGNGSQGHQSLYDEMGDSNGRSGINDNGSQGHQSLYDEMGKGSDSPMYTENPSSNSTPEPINSRNGGNEVSGYITPKPIQTTPSSNGNGLSGKLSSNNIPEPINHSRDNSSETNGSGRNGTSGHTVPNNNTASNQTIGQHQKQMIIEKVQNNPVVKQTIESYNRGKNTGQSIRGKNNNKNQ